MGRQRNNRKNPDPRAAAGSAVLQKNACPFQGSLAYSLESAHVNTSKTAVVNG